MRAKIREAARHGRTEVELPIAPHDVGRLLYVMVSSELRKKGFIVTKEVSAPSDDCREDVLVVHW